MAGNQRPVGGCLPTPTSSGGSGQGSGGQGRALTPGGPHDQQPTWQCVSKWRQRHQRHLLRVPLAPPCSHSWGGSHQVSGHSPPNTPQDGGGNRGARITHHELPGASTSVGVGGGTRLYQHLCERRVSHVRKHTGGGPQGTPASLVTSPPEGTCALGSVVHQAGPQDSSPRIPGASPEGARWTAGHPNVWAPLPICGRAQPSAQTAWRRAGADGASPPGR